MKKTPMKLLRHNDGDIPTKVILETPRISPRLCAARNKFQLRAKRVSCLGNYSKKFKTPGIQHQSPGDALPGTRINETGKHVVDFAQTTQIQVDTQEYKSGFGCVASASTSRRNAYEEMRNICEIYKNLRNISTFYDWQLQCLNNEHLINGTNMIISMTTGAGKTLVAEIVMLREVIVRRRSCIFIVPYVAIAQEKVCSLSFFEDKYNVCVEEYAASKGRLPPIKRRKRESIYVATIEKANMLINSLIEMNRIDEIGVIVVDELHMIGENTRGAIVEQGLIKFMQKGRGTGQIIGMSATLSNVEQLSKFLGAAVFSTEFRPVKLIEKVMIDNSLYIVQPDGKLEFEMNLGENKLKNRDPDGLVPLLHDIVPKRSVLIFCPTKQNCENVCRMVSHLMPKCVRERKKTEKLAAIKALKSEEDGKLSPLLELSITRGAAYHHSGLTADERKIIEDAFQSGIINIICCTSTLAAGVNLPARRVIIRAPFVGKEPLRKAQYLQMIGRAGRAGYDDIGEAVTIVHSGCEESKIAQRLEELQGVVELTLFGIQNNSSGELLREMLEYLTKHDLVSVDRDGNYAVSIFGTAVFSACLSPLMAQQMCTLLSDNLGEGIVLSSHFHLLFMMVPFDIGVDIDWNIFYEEVVFQYTHVFIYNFLQIYLFQYKALPKSEQNLLARLGLNDKQLIRRFIDRPKLAIKYNLNESESSLRLYISFMLHRLWKQEKFFDVAERFHVSCGWLQNVLQATCSQASSIARFAEKIPSFWPLKNLLPDLIQHLRDCSQQELIPLLALDGVKRGRARQLYNAGFKTIGLIASADPLELLSTIDHLNRRQANAIIRSAKVLLRDQLAEKVEELEEKIGIEGTEILAKFFSYF
uniref:Helicase POLQ-like n=1 Tax=Elaeophora elaphi TaxID=1147741 RepID=A0A0R3RV18_9BILA